MDIPMKLQDLNSITQHLPQTDKMPALFLGHGSPMNAIEENEFVDGLRNLGTEIARPSAVLCISAHWETRGTFVTAMDQPPTIHDFGGFPRELFQVQYPAPGSPELAGQVVEGVKKTEVWPDEKWGLDHGCWSVIKHLYPKADVPIVQLSLDYYQGPEYHYELAKELAFLRRKGVLIVGSGNLVHNLRMLAWDKIEEAGFGFDWAIEANETIKELIKKRDHKSLFAYQSLGTALKLAIPTPEHYLPMLYAVALQGMDEEVSFFNDKPVGGSLTMTSLKIS